MKNLKLLLIFLILLFLPSFIYGDFLGGKFSILKENSAGWKKYIKLWTLERDHVDLDLDSNPALNSTAEGFAIAIKYFTTDDNNVDICSGFGYWQTESNISYPFTYINWLGNRTTINTTTYLKIEAGSTHVWMGLKNAFFGLKNNFFYSNGLIGLSSGNIYYQSGGCNSKGELFSLKKYFFITFDIGLGAGVKLGKNISVELNGLARLPGSIPILVGGAGVILSYSPSLIIKKEF